MLLVSASLTRLPNSSSPSCISDFCVVFHIWLVLSKVRLVSHYKLIFDLLIMKTSANEDFWGNNSKLQFKREIAV